MENPTKSQPEATSPAVRSWALFLVLIVAGLVFVLSVYASLGTLFGLAACLIVAVGVANLLPARS